MTNDNISKNEEIIGLDKVTDNDINSSAKNRAVDLTKFEKLRPPIFGNDKNNGEEKMEIVKADDYGHVETFVLSAAAPDMQLEKISDADLIHPDDKIMSVNQDKLLARRQKAETITKDTSEAAPADISEREYKAMERISKKDEAEFAEHNKSVDLTMVTHKLCFTCGILLTDLEKQFFKNKCAFCYKRDSEQFKKNCIIKYISVIGLLILILILSTINYYTNNRALSIAFTVIECIAVGGITVFYTIGFLAKKVGKNMVSADYTLIALMTLALSLALLIYVAFIYLLIAIAFFVFTVIRDQKRIKNESKIYTNFVSARTSADLRAAQTAGIAVTKIDGEIIAK